MQPQIPRIVMIGDSSVGKTSLVERLCKNNWKSDTMPTVSTSFFVLKGDPDKDQSQDIQIWDTAGAERYRALNSVYYHNATGGILVFDLVCRDSFNSLSSWVDEFSGLAQPGATIVVVGNKFDLYEDPSSAEDRVKIDEAEKWCKAKGLKFITTSALSGKGIQELLDYVMSTIPSKAISYVPSSVQLSGADQGNDKGGCCK
ncbi:small GTP-binding protein [Histomonas meleagridis]|uniref:small GTP-binding protein n=1 Tax=Histomonas meleagridis TaxID=135588 RepID=UPI00355A519C|nr:small GTP-binding protein [Histomonas meleagridis]KAH0798448.1 small GTP-binding protein [Histomonas meleagridis]